MGMKIGPDKMNYTKGSREMQEVKSKVAKK
jgi:hypothetical protein